MARELPDTLPEQMRALLPVDSAVVSAEEAMAIAAIRARVSTDRAQTNRHRMPRWKLSLAGSRRPAWAWLAVIAVLAVVLVLGFRALPSPKPSGVPVSKPPVTRTTVPAPTTVPRNHKPYSAAWPAHTIATSGVAQDIGPTADGVYWLSNDFNLDPRPSSTTPFRYVPTTGRVARGPSITGTVGSPAITVTGGWVWMVVGVGDDVVVEQLDTSTLTLHARESLPVKNLLFGPGVDPVLTATVNGPLWVAGGEDLWALNPRTGAIETQFDTGNEIDSMSTDPTGRLLYTGAEGTDSQPVVTEYSAQAGNELKRSYPQGIVSAGVAATTGGVWVSYRTGMAGAAVELSANGLREIAPPQAPAVFPSTYDQIGGVGASVSEGALWVTSAGSTGTGTLTCADPATGAVRATESAQVRYPIASGALLYAFEGKDLVVITPPAKCFG